MRGWTIRDSLELFNVASWGAGFFGINAKGRVEVQTRRPDDRSAQSRSEADAGDGRSQAGPGIDLLDLVRDLEHRGLRTPLDASGTPLATSPTPRDPSDRLAP